MNSALLSAAVGGPPQMQRLKPLLQDPVGWLGSGFTWGCLRSCVWLGACWGRGFSFPVALHP